MTALHQEDAMATKSKLTDVAVKIGTAAGKADRRATKARQIAKEELGEISKQLDALKRQLEKTAKRLKDEIR